MKAFRTSIAFVTIASLLGIQAAIAGQPGFAASAGAAGRIDSPGNGHVTLAGMVVSSSGSPVSGARVRIVAFASGAATRDVTASTGSFAAQPAAAPSNHGDNRYLVMANSTGYFPSQRVLRLSHSHLGNARLVLSPDHGTVRGTAESADGTPVAAASIRLTSEATGRVATKRSTQGGVFDLSAPPLPSAGASDWYHLVVTSPSGVRLTKLLQIPPGNTVVTSVRPGAPRRAPATPGTRASRQAVQPTAVPSCPQSGETSWNGQAHDGEWTTAGNWTNGVPTANVYACVPAGAAVITIAATATAAGLLLGTGNTLTVASGSLTLPPNVTPSAIEGGLTVASSASVLVPAGALFLNASGGDIANAGSLSIAGGFEQDAGQIETSGQNQPVDMLAGASLTFAGTGAGAFEIYDPNASGQSMAVSLAGDIASNQSLDVKIGEFGSFGSGVTNVNAATFTNAGAITVDHISTNPNGSLAFNLPASDTLTNTGTFTVSGVSNQFSSTQTFTGNFTNQGGTLRVDAVSGNAANFMFGSGDSVLNEGNVDVINGSALTVLPPSQSAGPAVFTNGTGGTVSSEDGSGNPQTGLLVQGTFAQDAGTVASGGNNGPIQMLGGSSLSFGGAGKGAFEVDDPNATGQSLAVSLSGDIASTQSLDVKIGEFGSFGSGTTTINAAGSFTSAGSITVDHISTNGNGSLAFNLPASDTLTNTGTVTVTGPSNQFSSSQTFTGNFANQGGTLNVGATGIDPPNMVFASGDTFSNTGTVNVLTGSVLDMLSGTSFTNGAKGVVTNGNLLEAPPDYTMLGFLEAGSFEQDAGQVLTGSGDGPIDLMDGSSLTFGGTGAGAFGVYDTSKVCNSCPPQSSLSVSVAGDLAANQSLDVQTGEFGTRGSGTTIVNAAHGFTNAGTITLEHVGGSSPNGSVAFNLPSGQTLTNSGTFTVLGAPNQFSNTETFTGNFTNEGGTLNAGLVAGPNERQPTNFSFASGATFTNLGAIKINIGSVVDLPASSSFTNGPGGLITDVNPLGSPPNPLGFLDAGSFTQDTGKVAVGSGLGPVDLQGGSSLTFGGAGAGAFAFSDPNAPSGNFAIGLAGNLASEQSVDIKAGGFGQFGSGTTTVNAAGSFTNAGAITVEAGGEGNSNSGQFALNFPTGSSITNLGSISVSAGANLSATTQTFDASITNLGVFTVANQAQVVVTGDLTDLAGSTMGADVTNHPNQTMITVDGKTQLGGILTFQTDPNAKLSAGQAFHYLVSPTVTDGFDSVSGLYAGGQLVYDVSQGANTIDFTVASETTSPEAFAINPEAGPAATVVTVFGSDLLGTSSVNFGSKPATGFTVVSSTELTATAPSGIANGDSVPVTVTTPTGTSPSIGAPHFTYGAKSSGSAGSASLNLTVKDRVGTALPGVTVGVSDVVTRNPLGFIQTGKTGSGTLVGLIKGETVQTNVVDTLSPYGPASATYRLSGGANAKVLTLPILPLVTSDPTSVGPDGNAMAIWPQVAPTPGTPIPGGGSLSSARTLGDVEFTLQYTSGAKFILSSDASGTKPFCVDGKWTLTLSGPAPSTKVWTQSGSGCPASGSTLNIGSALGLTPGAYGGEFKAVAPVNATTAGATNIYMLPPAGKLNDLRPTPGQVVAHAQLHGTDTSVVGQSSKLNAILGGFPLPGADVYDVTFSYDPAGISVTSRDYPARWGPARQTGTFPNGIGVFYETNVGYPIPIGGTVVTLEVTCNQAGVWPIGFAGNYGVPRISGSYVTTAVEGSGVVICNAPPPAANTSANGVSIEPATGQVSVTVLGSSFDSATSAKLFDGSGSVAANSTTIAVDGSVATAEFPPTPPGLYGLKLLDSHGGTIAQTGAGSLEVAPALPLFSLTSADVVGDVPGIATTHSYSVSNLGTLNGVAVLAFTFPSYITTEPFLNMNIAPPGTRLLLHGLTAGGWAEYVAAPINVGFSDSLSWTYTVPPDAVYGPNPSLKVGQPIEAVPALAGQYTAPEWMTASSQTDRQVVDSAMAQGMNDYSDAFSHIVAMGAGLSDYMNNLSNPTMAGAITYMGNAILEKMASREAQLRGQDQVVAPPSPTGLPLPPPASSASQPADSLNDPAATSFANFSFNTGVAMAAGYGTNNPVASDGKPPLTTIGGKNGDSTLVGTVNTFKDGSVGPVVSLAPVAPGTDDASAGISSSWNASPNVDTSSWVSGVHPTLTYSGPAGPITAAALPFQETSRINTGAFVSVALPGAARSDASGGIAPPLPAKSTFVGHVFVSDPGTGSAHGARRAGQGSGNVGQVNSAATFGQAAGLLGNMAPSGGGLVVAAGLGILGFFFVGFPAAVILGVGAIIVDGPGQLAVQFINSNFVPNNVNTDHPLTTSLDPNDIQVQPSGGGAKSWIASQPITYTVRFFNQPKATAAAFNVVVKLPLDRNLDPATIQPGPSSFAGTQFAYNAATNVVTWNLPNIDLPPDTSPPNGEASVTFTVSPRRRLKTGTPIHESAQVLFDYNPPISTAPVLRTIDATPPMVSHVTASRHGNSIRLGWKASGPVPVSRSQVYISMDGGPLVPVTQTKHTGFRFRGQSGHAYGFAVQAQDVAGLTSTPPAAATVTVLTSCAAKPSTSLSCAPLSKGSWSSLTVPGHPASKLSISVRGKSAAPAAEVVERTTCPSNGLKGAVCFRFATFSGGTGLRLQVSGQPLAFTGARRVYVYARDGTFAALRHSSRSNPLAVTTATYMWAP